MKPLCAAITLFAIITLLFSACKKQETTPERRGKITCLSENYQITQRGVMSFHNLNLGDILAYNKVDKSLSVIAAVAPSIVDKKIYFPSISSEKLLFEKISNVEIDGGLDIANKTAIRAEVEKFFTSHFSLVVKDLSYEQIPAVLQHMEADKALKEYLSSRKFHDSVIDKNLTLLVVDKVYFCKQIFLVDSLNRKFEMGTEVPVKTVKGNIKLRIDASCNSMMETESVNQFKVLYDLRPFSLSKHFWEFSPLTNKVLW